MIGLSILSGAHMALCPRIMDLLRAHGMEDVLVLVGGIIPREDVAPLRAMGSPARNRVSSTAADTDSLSVAVTGSIRIPGSGTMKARNSSGKAAARSAPVPRVSSTTAASTGIWEPTSSRGISCERPMT